MARQVYFNPFGAYTEGFDTGMQRQMQQETNTRQNRMADFDYNYMLPFRYNTAQRNDALEAYGVPFAQNALRYNDRLLQNKVYGSDQDINSQTLVQTGYADPFARVMGQYYGITPSFVQGDGYQYYQFTPQGQNPAEAEPVARFDPTGLQQFMMAPGMQQQAQMAQNAYNQQMQQQREMMELIRSMMWLGANPARPRGQGNTARRRDY